MFRSLRFRVPAFFLAGLVLAGLVSTALSLRLFQDYTRDRTYAELEREARGLAKLYGEKAALEAFASEHLEEATGDRLFYVGLDLLSPDDDKVSPVEEERQERIRQQLPRSVVPSALRNGRTTRFEFVPPGHDDRFFAVAHPVKVGGQTFGALVVASPKDELRSRLLTLMQRLALAFAAGILVAGLLAWYLSRRISQPVLALSRAADEIAESRYDVELPRARGDEIGELANRFGEMATRLREADELERNFLMTVSHELRTPLTAIRGHLEALRDGVVSGEQARADSLSILLAETDRLERLVGDLLDLAKLEARRFNVRREEVDMGRVLDRAYAAFAEEARRRGIEYREDSDGRPVIVSDGDRVLQIITNLLENAFRWTPDGGRIQLGLESENGTVGVSVADSGPGIEASDRERIFRPFWSGDGRGTGLGLAIARELAEALGGSVELESEPGNGSRFRLVLPSTSAVSADSG